MIQDYYQISTWLTEFTKWYRLPRQGIENYIWAIKQKYLDFTGKEIWDAYTDLEVNKYGWKLKAGINEILYEENITGVERRTKGERQRIQERRLKFGGESEESADSQVEGIINSDKCNTILQ